MVVLNAVQSVLSIVFMISIGYYFTAKGWFDEKVSRLFSKIVMNISLPLYMISNLMTSFTGEKLRQSGLGIIIPFISMILCFLISIPLTKFIKVPRERKGTFQCMFFLSNTIFIGLPVNLALFGEHSVPYVLYYYFSNTTIFWTLGVYIIKQDGGFEGGRIFSMENIKNILSPPFLGFIFAILLILLNVTLPKSVMDTCKYMGNLTTPLSMLFIGTVLYSIKLTEFRFNIEMIVLLMGRFVISPLITFAFTYYFAAPQLMKDVFVIQAGLPVMANTAIVTKTYNANHKFAAVMIAVSTVASLLFMPIFMLLLT